MRTCGPKLEKKNSVARLLLELLICRSNDRLATGGRNVSVKILTLSLKREANDRLAIESDTFICKIVRFGAYRSTHNPLSSMNIWMSIMYPILLLDWVLYKISSKNSSKSFQTHLFLSREGLVLISLKLVVGIAFTKSWISCILRDKCYIPLALLRGNIVSRK